ncbi:MAG: 4Fe-4S dicluster domain-containing protein [Gammaproteobacteria bacterium]|nr:4Fe-4S dicluster domain-containing protein [Gammaproteobacteria bacterium]
MSEQPIDRYRRRLLGGAVAAGTVALAPGVFLHRLAEAKPADEPVTSRVRWGLLVDATRCADCSVCVDACREEHGWDGHGRPRTDAQWIRKLDVRDRSTGRHVSLPMMCQHCAEPPCVDVCPTGASFRRADGIVLVDKHICIGCRYCMMACPYKARSFVHESLSDQKPWSPRGKGTVESCTLCVHRVDTGREPACVEACGRDGNGALTFGDLNDPNSAIHRAVATYPTTRVRDDLGLGVGVRYRGL